MKTLLLLFLLPCMGYAGPYYELVNNTTVGTATMSLSGYFGVAASSTTPTTYKFRIDGPGGYLQFPDGTKQTTASSGGTGATQTQLDAHTVATSTHGAVSVATANRIIIRDATGSFAMHTASGTLYGNATTATTATNVPAAGVAAGSLGGSVIASSITLAAMYGAPTLTGTNFTAIPNAALVTPVIPSSATGSYTLSAATALALVSDPADCTAGQATTGINASGVAQGCWTPISSTATINSRLGAVEATLSTATAAATPSTIVIRDATGSFAMHTATGALYGNALTATTATNLNSVSAACGAGNYISAITTNGTTTCGTPANTTYIADGFTLALNATTFSAKASSVTLQANTFNGANQLVLLNASSQLPAVSGALITEIPQLTSTQTFTGIQNFGYLTGSSMTLTGPLTNGNVLTIKRRGPSIGSNWIEGLLLEQDTDSDKYLSSPAIRFKNGGGSELALLNNGGTFLFYNITSNESMMGIDSDGVTAVVGGFIGDGSALTGIPYPITSTTSIVSSISALQAKSSTAAYVGDINTFTALNNFQTITTTSTCIGGDCRTVWPATGISSLAGVRFSTDPVSMGLIDGSTVTAHILTMIPSSATGNYPLSISGNATTATTATDNVLKVGDVMTGKIDLNGAASNQFYIFKAYSDNSGSTATDGFDILWNSNQIEFSNRETAGMIFRTANAVRFTLAYDGNVGVGTEVPAAKLEVAGNIFATSNITSSGTITGASLVGPLTGTASTATVLAATSFCDAGQYATGISVDGTPTCGAPTGAGDVILAATQTFTGANTFTSSVTLPTRDKITFGNELHNSSCTLIASYAVAQATFLVAVTGSTLTITTNGSSSIDLIVAGTWFNGTNNGTCILTYILDGVRAFGTTTGIYGTQEPGSDGGAIRPLGVVYNTGTISAGIHTVSLAVRNDGAAAGTCTIPTTRTVAQFCIKELR